MEADNSMVNMTTATDHQRRRLPRWLNHFNPNDLKVTFRCWVAVWVATILMFINPSLQNIGTATFFGAIVLYIVPPAGILMVYLLASLSLLLGMCLAWAWGLLTMKAAYAVRSDAEVQGLLQSLQKEAAVQANQTGLPPAAIATELTFNGYFLDARVTVIFFVMCNVFIYALARLRHANGKFLLLQLFGTIVTDVFLLTGPVLTGFRATLPVVLVKPGAIGIGLGVACSVLIFPQSTSYVLLSQMEQIIRMLEAPLDSTRRLFNAETPLENSDLQASKGAIIGVFKAMEPSIAFLPLDFSRGRWNAEDVKGLHERVRDAVSAGLFLLEFHVARVAAAARADKLGTGSAANKTLSGDSTTDQQTPDEKLHENTDSSKFISGLTDALKSPEEGTVRAGLLETLRGTTAEVLQVNSQALKLVAETVHIVNASRWYLNSSSKKRLETLEAELKDIKSQLKMARESSVTNTNEGVVGAHADLFDDQGLLKDRNNVSPLALNGLVLSMVLEERIVNTAATTEEIIDYIAQLLDLRTQQRVWLPTRLRYAFSWLTSSGIASPVPGASAEAAEDPDDVKAQAEDTHKRLRLVSQGNKGAAKRKSLPTRAVVGTYRWLFNPGGIYALRIVVVTIAVSIPAILPSTAGFFYREKGIWAVIMAQTCLLMYMADFTFSLVSRGLGTVLGGALGLVAWYAGSGGGHGNPYGLSATTAIIALILIWWRLYLPPAFIQASIMTAATSVIIVGYSWDEYHTAQYGLPGVGYVAFWKRLVTVLIGFAAAFIVQIFPKPPSATRYVCKTLANHIRSLNNHYALLISQWNHSRSNGQNTGGAAGAEQITLKLAEGLMELTDAIRLLKVEVSTTPFDQKILFSTKAHCHAMNQYLGKLLVLSSTLPQHLQQRLVQTVGLTEDGSVSNIMSVLTIVESCLRTGAPMPERLPVPMVKSCFLDWYVHHERAELSVELIKSKDYRRYCVAVSAYLTFLATVDDLVGELKETLGETHVVHHWEEA